METRIIDNLMFSRDPRMLNLEGKMCTFFAAVHFLLTQIC